jgi:hypothetical protein
MTRLFLLSLLGLFSANSFANDAWVTIYKPTLDGLRLDWCYDWAVNCGAPAANAYCGRLGYRSDTAGFAIDNDIGLTGISTRLIGTGAVCDQGFCDGFSYVSCRKNFQDYANPTYGNRRLDWCLNWAVDCGKPAADKFCVANGFVQATIFSIDSDIGNTRLMGTGAVCDQAFCDGFKHIRCQ